MLLTVNSFIYHNNSDNHGKWLIIKFRDGAGQINGMITKFYKIPVSFKAFDRIVSRTAANTVSICCVSVAHV
jgi:hypothetical protein